MPTQGMPGPGFTGSGFAAPGFPGQGFRPPNPWPWLAPRDTRMRAVILVCAGLWALYGLQVILDLARPHVEGAPHPTIGLLDSRFPEWWGAASFWSFVVALPVALVIAAIGSAQARIIPDPVRRARADRVWQGAVALVLLLPFPWPALEFLFAHIPLVLVCVPGTVWALWLIHRMQRYRRMPLRLLLTVFAWGVVVAVGVGAEMEGWWEDYSPYYLLSGAGGLSSDALERAMSHVVEGDLIFAGVFEELGKGAAVACVYLLLRRHIDNVVSGVVLGAAAGLGFNLVESVKYMSVGGSQMAPTQFFVRQAFTLLSSHVAWAAAIGAGFGIARQVRSPALRRLAIGCGFVIGMATHLANDVLLAYFGLHKDDWFAPTDTTDLLVFTPLALLVLQGPLVALYLGLLHVGLRDQAAALGVHLRAEAATGLGAITAPEAAVLLRPSRRFHLRMTALQRGGLDAYRYLGRLFDAQLDLGMARWHRSRGTADATTPTEAELRHRIARLRGGRAARHLPPGAMWQGAW